MLSKELAAKLVDVIMILMILVTLDLLGNIPVHNGHTLGTIYRFGTDTSCVSFPLLLAGQPKGPHMHSCVAISKENGCWPDAILNPGSLIRVLHGEPETFVGRSCFGGCMALELEATLSCPIVHVVCSMN